MAECVTLIDLESAVWLATPVFCALTGLGEERHYSAAVCSQPPICQGVLDGGGGEGGEGLVLFCFANTLALALTRTHTHMLTHV